MSVALTKLMMKRLPDHIASNDRVAEARRRFGQPFAHEAGSTWQPRTVPLLTEWLSTRTNNRRST